MEACTCNVGYSGPDGGSCTACLAGKYKADTGRGACTDCDINTYSEAVGASSESSCQSCPENTASELGSTSSSDCLEGCPPGLTGDPGSCTDCEAGTYKATVGSDSCISCPDNTQSEAGQVQIFYVLLLPMVFVPRSTVVECAHVTRMHIKAQRPGSSVDLTFLQ